MATRVVLLTVAMWLAAARPGRADDLRERAHQEFTAAQADFDAGRFATALEHLERAYALVPHPELLFNIARCLEELHRTQAAVDAYDRYLAVMPGDVAARDRLTALRKQLAEHPELAPNETASEAPKPVAPAAAPMLVATPAPAPARTPLYRRWWLWTAVAGVVAVGVGVGLGVGLTRPAAPTSFPPLTAQ